MAHRIKFLVENQHIPPQTIQVLMFNALARKQFGSHLDKTGLPQNLQPVVHTFHSFSFQVIGEAIKRGFLPANTQFWLADKSELVWLTLKRAITELEKAKRIPPESIDPEEALNAIGVWKGSLIPPERAGSYASPDLPLAYTQFEQLRVVQAALTYDDFIPTAVELLENNSHLYSRYCRGLQHLIVDEYQDINLGQQRLIEILAGNQADVMVVGDDDQTIYEWRGARPNYIIHDFAAVFNTKPVKDYRLSRSFRFGPLIAQASANVIACNTNRVDKPLVAFQTPKPGFIQVYEGGYSAIKELSEQAQALINTDEVPPKEVVVLARLYAQLDTLEAEFLMRGIPYRVDGQEPFYNRREVRTLLDYIRLTKDYQEPLTDTLAHLLVSVANKPSRMLSRGLLDRIISTARQRRYSTQAALDMACYDPAFGLSRWQSRPIVELGDFLTNLQTKIRSSSAGEILSWMVGSLDYLAYFQNYYGKGEHSDEKAHAVTHFIKYVEQLHLSPLQMLNHIAQLDTTQGRPEEELILFTTIFRTKGLEFDYVLLPQVDENMLPYLKGEPLDVYDKQGISKESRISSSLESERRLFYVAITRARKGVLIGTSSSPSRFLAEMQLAQSQQVMGIVQGLACGRADCQQQLLELVQNVNQNPVLLQNLINGYLPDLGQEQLAEQITSQKIVSPWLGQIISQKEATLTSCH
jgi:DNA helicase-2/ATP-dependent DNA helicase PcrA